jgi:hypothetical protein
MRLAPSFWNAQENTTYKLTGDAMIRTFAVLSVLTETRPGCDYPTGTWGIDHGLNPLGAQLLAKH